MLKTISNYGFEHESTSNWETNYLSQKEWSMWPEPSPTLHASSPTALNVR